MLFRSRQESTSNSGISKVLFPEKNTNGLPIALRKGVRSCTQHPIAQVVKYDHLSSSMRAFVAKLEEVIIPKTIEEALQKKEWCEAVKEEMKALKKSKTWEIVTKPKDATPVSANGYLL